MPKMYHIICRLCTGKPLRKLEAKFGLTSKQKSKGIAEDASTAVVLQKYVCLYTYETYQELQHSYFSNKVISRIDFTDVKVEYSGFTMMLQML